MEPSAGNSDKDKHYDYQSWAAVYRILETLVFAKLTYERVGYRGPVRVRYELRAPGSFILDRNPHGVPTLHPLVISVGSYPTGPIDAFLQGGLTSVAKELLDPIFQAAGRVAAPWFDANGSLIEEKRKQLPPSLATHLE